MDTWPFREMTIGIDHFEFLLNPELKVCSFNFKNFISISKIRFFFQKHTYTILYSNLRRNETNLHQPEVTKKHSGFVRWKFWKNNSSIAVTI
jgi:hypothetical protein